MAEGRATTLLEFAIVASAAVVPVLLLVLLVVGVVRPLDPAGPTVRNSDRHVSVRQVAVQCAGIASAAAMLARSNGHMLRVLSWRGTEVARVTSHWRPEQFVEISARQIARANPWRGLPGCVFMGNSAPGADIPIPTYFVT